MYYEGAPTITSYEPSQPRMLKNSFFKLKYTIVLFFFGELD